MNEEEQLNSASCEDTQITVNELRQLLKTLSEEGYGDMKIYLGDDTPLMRSSVSIFFPENKFLIRNTYYDKAIVNATEKMKKGIKAIVREYISNCYDAGMMKESEEQK